MSGTLAVTPDQGFWDEKQLATLKQLGLSGASKGDLAVLLHYSQRTGLDPFARQIYMINRGGQYSIQTSIDGFRIVAQRSGNYGGQTSAEWCGEDGVWKNVWLSKENPAAARVGVYFKDTPHPTYAVAKWDSYAQNSATWKKMPDLMLSKCAEALALRKAFPQDLSGIYTGDEMEQAEPVSRFVSQSSEGITVISNPAVEVAKNEPVAEEINWDSLMEEFFGCETKEQYREFWLKCGDTLLDHSIEIPEFNGTTLRRLVLAEIAEIDSAAKLGASA